jgi:hypothetical protein
MKEKRPNVEPNCGAWSRRDARADVEPVVTKTSPSSRPRHSANRFRRQDRSQGEGGEAVVCSSLPGLPRRWDVAMLRAGAGVSKNSAQEPVPMFDWAAVRPRAME